MVNTLIRKILIVEPFELHQSKTLQIGLWWGMGCLCVRTFLEENMYIKVLTELNCPLGLQVHLLSLILVHGWMKTALKNDFLQDLLEAFPITMEQITTLFN